jgi:iron complex outermembrane receptor protein
VIRWLLRGAPVALHLALVVPASADDAEKEDDAESSVVVHGRPPPRSASEVTQERDVLEAAPHFTASDMMVTVPGVFVTQHGGEGKAHQIFFRGFDAVHGQDLEIFAGGIPVNEVSNVHGQGYADLHFLMPEVVHAIHALPGSFDPRQGDFAIAGSMYFDLAYPEPGITTSASYGTFATRRLFMAYHPEGQPAETFAAGELHATDGYGVARAAERASGVAQVVFPLARGLSGRVLTTVYVGRFDSPGVLRRRDVEAGLVDRFASYGPDQGGRSTRGQLAAELDYDRDGWEVQVTPFLLRRALRLEFDFTGFLVDPEHGDNTTQHHDFTSLGLHGAVRKQLALFSESDSIGGGVYARHDFIDQGHAPTHGGGPALVDAAIGATDVGLYLDASLHPVDRLAIRGGVRADALAFAVDDRVSGEEKHAAGFVAAPRVSIDLGVVPGLNVAASYGQGFRSPQARSVSDGEDAPFTRSHAFELGARFRDNFGVGASIAGFATLLDEDLVFNEAIARNESVPGTLRLGVAAEASARVEDWFVTAASVSYTRATFREGDERVAEGDLLPFVPQLVLRGDVSARPILARLGERDLRGRLGLGMGYVENRPLPFGEVGSDVLLFDAALGFRLGEVECGVEATNLLGADWYDGEFVYASSFERGATPSLIPQRHVTAGAPRSVVGTLTLHL